MIKLIRNDFQFGGRKFKAEDKIILEDYIIYHVYYDNGINIDKIENSAELEKLIILN